MLKKFEPKNTVLAVVTGPTSSATLITRDQYLDLCNRVRLQTDGSLIGELEEIFTKFPVVQIDTLYPLNLMRLCQNRDLVDSLVSHVDEFIQEKDAERAAELLSQIPSILDLYTWGCDLMRRRQSGDFYETGVGGPSLRDRATLARSDRGLDPINGNGDNDSYNTKSFNIAHTLPIDNHKDLRYAKQPGSDFEQAVSDFVRDNEGAQVNHEISREMNAS